MSESTEEMVIKMRYCQFCGADKRLIENGNVRFWWYCRECGKNPLGEVVQGVLE